jgi:hypothetical protein
VFSGKAISAAVLSMLVAAAVLAPSAGATKPCPAGYYCTDANGKYVLSVPPLTYNPFLAEYADCVWQVHVDFGDGTSEDYVFDAAVGLTGEHVFPTAGVTYTVVVQLREGVHDQSGEPCPDYGQTAQVRYRTAAEEADDPPETPTEPPFVPVDQGGTVAPPVAADGEVPNFGQPGQSPDSARYWKRCGGGVYAHLVRCRRARGIARAAGARLARPGTALVKGFSCRLPRGPLQSIACKRGEQSVLAPGPDKGRRGSS